jgi:hypothetical protein
MKSALVLTLLAGLATACSSSTDSTSGGGDGQGTAAFTTYGEDYIEQEIPASEFEDAWSVKYDRFLIAIHDVSVAEEGKGPAALMGESKVFDMHKPGDKPVITFPNLPGKPYTHVSYRIGPPNAASLPSEGATAADKDLLTAGGFGVYVEGSLSKDGVTKTFKWGFTTNTLYDRCEGELSGKKTEGVVVTNGGTDLVQLTIHGDHLFYDDLQAANAKVRGGNIAAADANNDNVITLEELGAVKLTSIAKENGSYGTGSAANINDLRTFVEALSRTLGHFRGEGECFASAK